MKLGFLIGHPTQFEGPFFQYAARQGEDQIRVLYTTTDGVETVFDPELSARVSWGVDLLGGYPYAVLPSRRRLRWLREEIKREKYDLLIINGYRGGEYVFAALIARLSGTPIALRLDSVLFRSATFRKRLLKRAMFVSLSILYQHFFAIGTLTVEYLRHFGIPRNRISIFSYVVDNDYFGEHSRVGAKAAQSLRNRYQVPEGATVILSVTKFHGREAPWDLLKAFCESPPRDRCLLLVGDGSQRAALEEYADAHSEHSVTFAGYVPYPELPALYGIADLFVHPALDEPWGVSVQEALASRLPVIASSRVGAAYDLITPGKNGLIYQVGDSADLGQKVAALLDDFAFEEVQHENERLLSQWNYETTWRTILEVGQRYAAQGKR